MHRYTGYVFINVQSRFAWAGEGYGKMQYSSAFRSHCLAGTCLHLHCWGAMYAARVSNELWYTAGVLLWEGLTIMTPIIQYSPNKKREDPCIMSISFVVHDIGLGAVCHVEQCNLVIVWGWNLISSTQPKAVFRRQRSMLVRLCYHCHAFPFIIDCFFRFMAIRKPGLCSLYFLTGF